jgi:hypothetical protein
MLASNAREEAMRFHFLVNVDVWIPNITPGIGIGMIRFEDLTKGSIVGLNTAHPYGGTTVSIGAGIVDQSLEDHLLALVRLPIDGAGDIGIGQILGDDLNPGPFGIERRAGALNTGDEFDHREGLPKV